MIKDRRMERGKEGGHTREQSNATTNASASTNTKEGMKEHRCGREAYRAIIHNSPAGHGILEHAHVAGGDACGGEEGRDEGKKEGSKEGRAEGMKG
jgi:hypothetical protein